MLGFKIKQKKQEEISKVLDKLDSYFYVIFRKVIPDNSDEFTNFELLEKSIHDKLNKRMEVYYTHTYASYEKPSYLDG